MCSKIAIILLSLVLVFSVSGFENGDAVYNKFVNITEVATKIKNTLGNNENADLATIKMIDAWTKFPSGILEGNFLDLGSFDECYSIHYNNIYGKYCLGTLHMSQTEIFFKMLGNKNGGVALHPQPRASGLEPEFIGIHFAACVPSTWSASDIPGIFTYDEKLCYSKATQPDLSAGAIATISLLSVVLLLVVVSTSYEVFLFYYEKEPRHEVLIAFSVLSNGRKIFRSTSSSEQLLCLNGIKAISMMWVIIGHEYSLGINGPFNNVLDIMNWNEDSSSMFIIGATVAVDTFFVVGGLVTVYTYLKSIDKGVKFNIFLFYLHRYLRITPAFFITGLVYLYLVEYLGNGPLWRAVYTTLVQDCEKGWWASLLYITNYATHKNCVPPSWYLTVDMQFYLLSPIILIPLVKWPRKTLGALGALIVAGCIIPFAVTFAENLEFKSRDADKTEKYQRLYYNQTYARFGPYVIGMTLGYFIYQIKKSKIKIMFNLWMVFTIWLVCLTGLVVCVYAGYPLSVAKEYDRWGNSMYLAFNRPAWAVALSGVIFMCVAGYGGPIDLFLSLPVFQFLTKLSYSMYLVHYAVITMRYSAMRNSVRFSNISLMHSFWGDFMFTLALSLVLCLTFESPIIILEKYIFGSGARRKPVTKNVEIEA